MLLAVELPVGGRRRRGEKERKEEMVGGRRSRERGECGNSCYSHCWWTNWGHSGVSKILGDERGEDGREEEGRGGERRGEERRGGEKAAVSSEGTTCSQVSMSMVRIPSSRALCTSWRWP